MPFLVLLISAAMPLRPASATPRPHACIPVGPPAGVLAPNAGVDRRFRALSSGLRIFTALRLADDVETFCVTPDAVYLDPAHHDPRGYTGPPTRDASLALFGWLLGTRQVYYGRRPPDGSASPAIEPDRIAGCALARAGVPPGDDLAWQASELLRLTPGEGDPDQRRAALHQGYAACR